jgi:hypothetical protein
MSRVEGVANVVCTLGALLWVYGYFVVGHPPLLNWSSFSPLWVSSFLPNVESEIGMVVSLGGMLIAYGLRWLGLGPTR